MGLTFFMAVVGLRYGYDVVSSLTGSGLILALSAVVVEAVAVIVSFFIGHKIFKLNWIILSGAIGNLIDRIFLGYVRDFIHVNISIMPYYFNFADAFLTVGVVLFIIEILFKREHKTDDRKIENK